MFSGGFIGVDIFFVLSGYLITSILTEEFNRNGTIHTGRFYIQRFLRLLPALLLFLSAYLAVAPWIWPGHPHMLDALVTGTYLSDYAYPFFQTPFYIRHTWSLAVEEQFYLIWPLILPFLVRQRHALIILTTAWIALSLWRLSFIGAEWSTYYYRFDTHCTGLIAGAILALVQKGWSFGDAGTKIALFGLFAISLLGGIERSTLTIAAAEVFSFMVIGHIASGNISPLFSFLSAGPVVKIGKLSYGLYLWHFPIAYYFREQSGFLVSVSVTFTLSLAGAFLSYHTVEKWGRSMKARAKLRPQPASVRVTET